MASLAKITLIGNLGGDPETRYTPQGTLVVNFSLAVNNRRRDASGNQQENTNWYRVSAFGRLAETMVNLSERGYLTKGKQVYIDGNFEAREWTGNDGQTRTSLDVTAREMQLLGQRGDEAGGEHMGGGGGRQAQQPAGNYDSDMDDVPF
ncbi:MAG TPA: single-stranded DNA-binding protein [Thermomicrobiales bacterium]|nr:single-stranded DNA-binding protein [Thermomicrobiales bacterium]